MTRPRTVTLADQSFTFDEELVNGADAWSFLASTKTDLMDVLVELNRCIDAEEPPSFHVVVVAKWLAIRQAGAPSADFGAVAYTTVLPFPKADD